MLVVVVSANNNLPQFSSDIPYSAKCVCVVYSSASFQRRLSNLGGMVFRGVFDSIIT